MLPYFYLIRMHFIFKTFPNTFVFFVIPNKRKRWYYNEFLWHTLTLLVTATPRYSQNSSIYT